MLIDVRTALALMTVPIIANDNRQTFRGGMVVAVVRHFWIVLVLWQQAPRSGAAAHPLDTDTVLAAMGFTVIAFVLLILLPRR